MEKELRLIEKNRQKRKQGIPLCIPYSLPTMERIGAGFTKGRYIIFSANSGQGKTKFCKFILLSSILKHIEQYPHKKIKVLWFALEEPREYFYISILANLLYNRYNISYSPVELISMLEAKEVNDDLMDKIKSLNDELKYIKSIIQCFDGNVDEDIADDDPNKNEDVLLNSYGIYKKIRNYMLSVGENVIEDKNGEQVISGYKYYDEDNTDVFVVVDHSILIPAEKGKDQWATLQHFSQEYILNQCTKRYKCISLIIWQQAQETERIEYFQGETVENKVKPTMGGLSTYKNAVMDCTDFWFIYDPAYYNLKQVSHSFESTKGKLKVTDYGHSLRIFGIKKDRLFGNLGLELPLLFDGASNTFKELY